MKFILLFFAFTCDEQPQFRTDPTKTIGSQIYGESSKPQFKVLRRNGLINKYHRYDNITKKWIDIKYTRYNSLGYERPEDVDDYVVGALEFSEIKHAIKINNIIIIAAKQTRPNLFNRAVVTGVVWLIWTPELFQKWKEVKLKYTH